MFTLNRCLKKLAVIGFALIVLTILSCSGGDDASTNPDNTTVPVLTTATVSAITQITVQSGGNITSDGGAAVTVRGVCWSTSATPTIANSKTSDGTGIGSFASSISGLSGNTPYYVRAYATNSAGTGYGNAILFTTSTTATIYVPADQPTIQAGIDAAVNGDTVLVADGTYTGVGNKNIEFRGKSIVCRSESGPEYTIIDGENDGRAFSLHEGEDTTSVIEGFTIRNCRVSGMSHGGGINANGASPTIKNNIVYDCYAGRGGGILCENNTAPIILNNTVMYNVGGGIQAIAGTIRNNISRDNGWFDFTIGAGTYPSSYNNFGGAYEGEGNVNLDPLFVDSAARDFRLEAGSPCINAGDPDPQYNDPDGTRSDMGALYFNQTP